jgi:hypothetical protein
MELDENRNFLRPGERTPSSDEVSSAHLAIVQSSDLFPGDSPNPGASADGYY